MTAAAPAAPAAAAPASNAAPAPAPAAEPKAAPSSAAPAGGAAPASDPKGAPAAAAGAAKPAEEGTILGGTTDHAPKEGKEGAPKEGEPAAKPQGAPEKYADFTLPEGMSIDAKAMDDFKALAKSLDLPQDAGQKLVDFQSKVVAQQNEAQLAAFQKMKADWKQESMKSFGASYEADFAIAAKAIERLGTPVLRQVLNDTGLANHPELVKFAHAAGKLLSEDHLPEGGKGKPEEKSMARLMYEDKMGARK